MIAQRVICLNQNVKTFIRIKSLSRILLLCKGFSNSIWTYGVLIAQAKSNWLWTGRLWFKCLRRVRWNCFRYNFPNGSGIHSVSYPVGTKVVLFWCKVGQSANPSPLLRVLQRWRMHAVLLPYYQYTYLWRGVEQKDNFTSVLIPWLLTHIGNFSE
jgi:hypothetical protein